MIVQYDLTEDVRDIARRLGAGGRLEARYASPAWVVELTTPDGAKIEGVGPTSPQAFIALGRKLRREQP